MTEGRAIALIAGHEDCYLATSRSDLLVIVSKRQKCKLTILVEDLDQVSERDFVSLLNGKVRGIRLPRYSVSVL